VFFAWGVLAPSKPTAGRGLLATQFPPLPPPRFASTTGGTCAFFRAATHCSRPPPSPLPTPLKLCGPPPGLPILSPFNHPGAPHLSRVLFQALLSTRVAPRQLCRVTRERGKIIGPNKLATASQKNYVFNFENGWLGFVGTREMRTLPFFKSEHGRFVLCANNW
jgi:hypothetical protein